MLVVYDIGYQASNQKGSFDLTSKRIKRERKFENVHECVITQGTLILLNLIAKDLSKKR